MSLELVKEPIRLNRIIGGETTQAIVENDIIVPDTKPDISRIILMDGDVYITDSQVANDKVLVNGTICYKILYESEDAEQKIRGIHANAGFTCNVVLPNAKPGMKCRVKCAIEYIDFEMRNSRKVNAKAVLNVNAKVTEEMEQQVVSDIEGAKDIQVQKSDLNMNLYIGSNEINVTMKETAEIPEGKPAIREILRSDMRISGRDISVMENKVVMKGEANVSTLYIADNEDNSIQCMEHEFPFTYFVDLPGVNEEAMCNTEYRVIQASFEAEEDSDGELRVLKAEMSFNLWAEAYCSTNMKTVTDAYGLKTRLELEREPVVTEQHVACDKSQAVLKDTLVLEESNPDISEVLSLTCKASLSDYTLQEDKIVLEGVVNNKMIYLADNADAPVSCHVQEFPLKHAVEIKGLFPEMCADLDMEVENSSFNIISPREAEIRVVINVYARVSKQSETYLIKKANEALQEAEKQQDRPSIVIYFAQPGDTLWSIAKKYCTTMDVLCSVNELSEEGAVNPGQQIIIPKCRF